MWHICRISLPARYHNGPKTKLPHLSPRVSCVRGDEHTDIARGQFCPNGAWTWGQFTERIENKLDQVLWGGETVWCTKRKLISDKIQHDFYTLCSDKRWFYSRRHQLAAADSCCNYSPLKDLLCSATFAHTPKLTNKSRLLYPSFSSSDHIKTSFPNSVQMAVIALI